MTGESNISPVSVTAQRKRKDTYAIRKKYSYRRKRPLPFMP